MTREKVATYWGMSWRIRRCRFRNLLWYLNNMKQAFTLEALNLRLKN